MDKCYRVIYTNKDGETLAGMWGTKETALSWLDLIAYTDRPAKVYNELDLTVDVLYNVIHAEIEEL